MITLLIIIPLIGGLASFIIRPDTWRRALLLGCAGTHGILAVLSWTQGPQPVLGGWLALDDLGRLFLTITSVLFFAAALYAVSFLNREARGNIHDFEDGTVFYNAPEAIFSGCLLLFLASMTLVVTSQHFGMLWVAVEATTLSSAPLIYFHRHHRSLEAAWKYLLICSVGIALGLLGTFFLAASASRGLSSAIPLMFGPLLERASTLHILWLKAAFIFLLVGYGTKMGLAPMHTWLPDAHSESPSVVSALLSGALLNCAFLGILRVHHVCVAAGLGEFSSHQFIIFGLLSMGVAAVFMLGQTDYKRLLAYSSIEHMGILAMGVGLGQAGTFGAMLHAVNHSLTKAVLFLTAGNILHVFKSKSTSHVHGLLKVMPQSGIIWICGFLAITGLPPFGLFISELTILKAAFETNHIVAAVLFLCFLAMIFMGMASAILPMVQGDPSAEHPPVKEPTLSLLSPVVLGICVLILGVYIPPFLNDILHRIAMGLGRV